MIDTKTLETLGFSTLERTGLPGLLQMFTDNIDSQSLVDPRGLNPGAVLETFKTARMVIGKFDRAYRVSSRSVAGVSTTKPAGGLSCRILSEPVMGDWLGTLRSIDGLRAVWWNLATNEPTPINSAANPGITPATQYYMYTGLADISLIRDSSRPNVLPAAITQVLKPVAIDQLAGKDSGVLAEKALASEVFDDTRVSPMVANQISKASIHFGVGLNSPVAFEDIGWMKSYIPKDQQETVIKAIELLRVKGEFKLVDVKLGEVFDNPSKYVVVFEVPKIINLEFRVANSIKRQYIRFCAPIQTLIMSPELLYSTGETARMAADLIEAINRADLNYLLDKEKYKELLAEFPEVTQYWDGAVQVVGSMSVDILKETFDQIKDIRPSNLVALTADVLKANTAIGTLVCKDEFQDSFEKRRAIEIQDRLQAQINKNIAAIQTAIANCEGQIADLKNRIDFQQAMINQYNGNRADAERQFQESQRAVDAAILDLATALNGVRNSIASVASRAAECSKDLIITSITLVDPRGQLPTKSVNFKDLGVEPALEAFVTALQEGLVIGKVDCITTRPLEIYVDSANKPRHQCDVVVGGPYRLSVSVNPESKKVEGFLFLEGAGAVFGIKPVDSTLLKARQHPHSTPMDIHRGDAKSFSNFFVSPTKMCFGDIELSLQQAFARGDIEQIRMMLLAWVTSANPKDQWGVTWTYFPAAHKVNMPKKGAA